MSEMTNTGVIPQWDAADRLSKALREAGVSVNEMATYLGVSRNTVGRYINGRGSAARGTLRLWAFRTGVPLAWLEHGIVPPRNGDDDGVRARRDSNSRPED